MRRRILLLVAGAVTVVVLAYVIPLALLVRHAVYQDATDSLRDEANRVANYLRSSNPTPTSSSVTAYLRTLPDDRTVCVEYPDGTVVGTPPPGKTAQLPTVHGIGSDPDGDDDAGHPTGNAGHHPDADVPQATTVAYQGGRLTQLPVLDPDGDGQSVVRVYASDSQLHSGETGWWLLLGLSSAGLLLVGIGAAELLTRRLVRPLTHTATTAHRMSAGDVTARAPVTGPREIAEVGKALNRLGDRIDELIAEERETVADLSHRLRTPLTALRLDAEALRDPDEATRIGNHVTSLERTLTAVIHAARRPQREGRIPSCDATAVVKARVAFWSALADDQGRRCDLEAPDAALLVRTSEEDLAAAVDALLENVIAHTPEGTAFRVRIHPDGQGGGAVLEVEDDGPGLPAVEPVRGRSDRGSSGLGLDIARRCAEASGGTLETGRSPSGGALVVLRLGAAVPIANQP